MVIANMKLELGRNCRQRAAIYGFRGGAGGISHVTLNLINALVDRGIHVDHMLNRTRIQELTKVREDVRLVESPKSH